MAKINSFKIGNLRNEESFAFNQKVAKYAQQYLLVIPPEPEEDEPVVQSAEVDRGAVADGVLQNAIDTHATDTGSFDTSLKQSTKTVSSEQTQATDAERDTVWTNFHSYVRMMLNHPTAATAAAAKTVLAIFDKYGNPTQKSEMEESGVLHNLIQDLNNLPEETKQVLGIEVWITTLETAQANFEAADDARAMEKAGYVVGLVQSCRDRAEASYRHLVEVVNAHCLLFGDEPYATFVDLLNVMVDHEKAVLKARATSNKNKENEGEEDTTPETDETTPPTDDQVTPSPTEPSEDEPVVQ